MKAHSPVSPISTPNSRERVYFAVGGHWPGYSPSLSLTVHSLRGAALQMLTTNNEAHPGLRTMFTYSTGQSSCPFLLNLLELRTYPLRLVSELVDTNVPPTFSCPPIPSFLFSPKASHRSQNSPPTGHGRS